MSKKESGMDVCPECAVRDRDSSGKRVYQCQYCERWFCQKHLDPRLAVFRDLNKLIKDKEWRTVVEEDWKREDGHPDYAYTKERFDELKIEKRILGLKIGAFLDKSRAYRKTGPREQYVTIGEHHICPSCGSNNIMSTAYREEYEAFQCLSCQHTWKEGKSDRPRAPEANEKPMPIVEASFSRKMASATSRKMRNYLRGSPNFMKVGLLIFAILLLEYVFLRVYFNSTIYVFVALGALYLTYKLFIMSSRIQVTSDLRLWGLRILSGLVFLAGLLLVIGAFMSYAFSALAPKNLDNSAYVSVFVFFGVFGLGLMLLSSYLMFRFTLRSGVIIYRG